MKKLLLFALVGATLLLCNTAYAEGLPTISFGVTEASGPGEVSTAIKTLLVLTILSMAPAILLMTTAFPRIIIVMSFARQALGTQQMPPNQVVVGLAMFLTFFIMAPVYSQINDNALQPYLNGKMSQEAAMENALKPVREFMMGQVEEQDLELMLGVSGVEEVSEEKDIPTVALIPAFMLSELKKAFTMGFLIYIPFLVIDMVVASTLMGMGMMMLPPPIISLPFKILLFVMVDGWGLIVSSLVKSFS